MKKEIESIIEAEQKRFATTIITQLSYQKPALMADQDKAIRQKYQADMEFHLSYLAEAIALARPLFFADYLLWVRQNLVQDGVTNHGIMEMLGVMKMVFQAEFSDEDMVIINDYLNQAIATLHETPPITESLIVDTAPYATLAREYLDRLLKGERQIASSLILNSVETKMHVKDIYIHIFQPVQRELGRLWQENIITVAEEHYCTAATQLIMSQLYPHIFSINKKGRILVATCISGNLHEIGIRMVADFFELAGWDTFYLGADTPTLSVIETIAKTKADVLAISATLNSQVTKVRELITQVHLSTPASKTKIMVGGYPFNHNPNLWQELKADGYAENADLAVTIAEGMVN